MYFNSVLIENIDKWKKLLEEVFHINCGQPVVNVLLYIALRFTTYTKLAPGFQGFPENRR